MEAQTTTNPIQETQQANPIAAKVQSTENPPTEEQQKPQQKPTSIPTGSEVVHKSKHKSERKEKKKKEHCQPQQVPTMIHLQQLGSISTVETLKLRDGELDQLLGALTKEASTRNQTRQKQIEKLKT